MKNWAWDYEESGERHEWYYHIYSDDQAFFPICITAFESSENDNAVDDLVNVLNMQYRRLRELQNLDLRISDGRPKNGGKD